MSRFAVAWSRRRVTRLVVCLAWVLSARPSAGQPASPPDPNDILLPGGAAALLRAAGVTVPVDPPRTLLVLTRNLYGPFAADPEGRVLQAVRTSLGEAAPERRVPEWVPGLLPPGVWQGTVFRRDVAPAALAAAIILDRRASLLYYGLFSLDDETVGFFAAHPDLVTSVYRRWPELFAAYAEGLHVRGGRMRVPGGEAAARAWEQALGVSAADPAHFVTALFERSAGRLVQLFGALGRLDPPHLAFALGPAVRDLPELIASAARFNPDIEPPFISWSEVDVPFLLEHVQVTSEGRLAPPRGRWFWEAAFGGQAVLSTAPLEGEVTAPRLVDLFGQVPRTARRLRFDMLLFAQRRFAEHRATGGLGVDEGVWLEPVARFPARQTLLLTLEQMQFVDPGDYRRSIQAAGALETGFDASRASRRVAVFQAMVSLIAQCQRAGSVPRDVAQGLVSTVFRMAAAGADEFVPAALDCLRRLVAGLPASPSAGTAEDRLLDGLAGNVAGRPQPVVEWEGRRYTVDLARAERRRLEGIRERQGGRSLDDILELGRAVSDLVDGSAAADRMRQAAAVVLATGADGVEGGEESLLGFRVDGTLEDMLDAARVAGRLKGQRSESARERLVAGLEVMLAEVLLAHVYALWLDPETPIVPGDGPDRRHDLGLRTGGTGGPWLIPRTVGDGTSIKGSLLGLDRCLAREALRASMVGLPGRVPTLPSEDARGLAESVVALNPLTLTDEGAELIAGAVKRGRARLAASTGDREALDAALIASGVDGIRRRLAGLGASRGAPGVLEQVSLSEVLTIGRQDAAPIPESVLSHWGAAARLVDGSLGQRMPGRLSCVERAGRPGGGLLGAHMADLQIRVAEWLTDRRLPAILARGVLAMATWDLSMHAQVANPDDWLSVVRAAQSATDQQFEDYVWALAAGGGLVPVGPSRD